MTFLVFSCMALPLWAAIFLLYFYLKQGSPLSYGLIAKCAGSFIGVSSVGLALYLGGENPLTQPVFWFLVLCTVADALLELHFVTGMLVFGGAHICLIVWLWSIEPPVWWSLAVWIGAYGITALLFRKEIKRLGKLTLPFCLYPGLLGASLALAVPLPFIAGGVWWPAAIGTLCFFISDMMVAKAHLSRLDPRLDKPVMLLYWGALYLISASIWAW